MEKNPDLIKRTDWDVTWDAFAFGLVDAVNPDLKYTLDDIKAGTTGKIILGERFAGANGTIKVVARQITTELVQKVVPWYPAITPPLNADLYSYARLLVLHPAYLPADDPSLDMWIAKATPVSAYNLKRDGEKDDAFEIVFNIYPDREKLLLGESPELVYGGIGAVAT
jgi:hypothetical protein